MVGFFTEVTGLVPRDVMREAVRSSVPAGTEELNLRAFDAGVDYFNEAYRKKPQRKERSTVAAGAS